MTQPVDLLVLDEVHKWYGPEASADGTVKVIAGITLAVRAGASLAIVGPSGSGKSTLLNLIGGLDSPSSGRVMVAGRELNRLSEEELALYRNTEVGFMFQLHHLLPQCTVLENVLLPTLAQRRKKACDEYTARASMLLGRVGLAAHTDSFPGRLSGGERQRVAVVRALINQPKIILADEPTGALDQATARELAELLLELNHEQGVTLITATHSLELAARMQCVYALRNGKLSLKQVADE